MLNYRTSYKLWEKTYKYRIVNNNSSQVVTYTYTNCSSVASSIDVFPASPTTPFVEICALTYPETTITDLSILNNITITTEACGLPCP